MRKQYAVRPAIQTRPPAPATTIPVQDSDMNRTFPAITLAFFLAVTATPAAAAAKQPATELEKVSYAVGILFARNMALETKLDTESFLQGIRDVLEEAELKLSLEEMQQVLQQFQERQVQAQEAQAKKNLEESEKFLAANGRKEGVRSLPTGLQYREVRKGSGSKPSMDDTVLVHYRGTLINGKEFDSSYQRGEPAEIPLRNVIPGWQQAVTAMPVGSKWEVYVPPALGYGDQAVGPDIEPNSTLIFEIDLLEIRKTP
jgi:FKBP-type peptidyl-prolyl cis-trans isomerase FklB